MPQLVPARARSAARRVLAVAAATAVVSSLAVTTAGSAAAESNALGQRTGYAVGGNLQDRSDAELARELDLMAASGAKWVRLDVNWASTERVRGVRDWAPMDRVVDAIGARGLNVLGLVTYAPAWARPAGSADHAAPTDVAGFASFAQAAVVRYKDRGIKAWEVWNEPNIHNFWAPAPNVAAYATLLKATSAAIRQVDPGAEVLAGGLSPAYTRSDGSTIAPLDFVKGLYAAGAGPSFTGTAMHPYSFPHLPTTPNSTSWNAFMQTPLVHQVMTANGDGAKKVWLTEVGAPTGTAADAVTEAVQTAIVLEAVNVSAGWSFAGPTFVYAVRDAGTLASDREQNFGLVRRDYSPKPVYGALRTALTAPAPAPAADLVVAPAPTVAPTTGPEPTTAPAPVVEPAPTTSPAPVATRPAAPARPLVKPRRGTLALDWADSSATGLVGYHVYRTTNRPGTARYWTRLTTTPVPTSLHTDRRVRPGVRYYYKTTAVTTMQSPVSSEASGVPYWTPRYRLAR